MLFNIVYNKYYRHCIQMLLIAVLICKVYNNIWTLLIHQVPAYKEHSYAMPIFVVNNNISAFFIHKIENFPIQLAIFDIFRPHFVQPSLLIINTLYTRFCMSYIGITYKFLFKQSLYSAIPTVYVITCCIRTCFASKPLWEITCKKNSWAIQWHFIDPFN